MDGQLTEACGDDVMQRGATKKSPTLVQLLLLNAVVCGLEFCSSAGFTYIPPMLLKAGLPELSMSIVLGLGPLLGFLLVPVIGRSSDRCTSVYGRRRPFILGLGFIVILSLLLIPYGELVTTYLLGKTSFSKPLGVGMLIVGVVLLHFSSEACLTPCEALLSDCCKDTDQSERAFTLYSFLISIGGCIGYLMAALDWRDSSVGSYFGGQEQSAFSLLIVLFTVTMLTTLLTADECPVDATSSTWQHTPNNNEVITIVEDPMIKSNDSASVHDTTEQQRNPSRIHVERKYNVPVFANRTCEHPFRIRAITRCKDACSSLWAAVYSYLPSTVQNLVNIPSVLRPLVLANFFSWSAVMCFNLFYTDFVGQAVYGGNPNADDDDLILTFRYDEGVRMASWGLLLHCVTSAIYGGYVIQKLVDAYGCKALYVFGNVSFSLAMLGMLVCWDVNVINILAAMTGFAYATLTTIPFWLITQYHENREVFFYDAPDGSKLTSSPRGIGMDIASLDSAFFLAQVLLSLCMGSIVHITGSVQTYIMVAGLMGLAACYWVNRVIYDKRQMVERLRN